MVISKEQFETTKIINNIKNHDFTVADYKMSEDEAVYVMFALKDYLYKVSKNSKESLLQRIVRRLHHDSTV